MAMTITQHKKFARALRELRESRGLTQTDLSASSGISQSTVSALETGKQRPWPSTRRALAQAFGMTMPEFDRIVLPQRQIEDSPSGMPADSEPALTDDPAAFARSMVRLVDQFNFAQDRLRRAETELGLIRRLIDEMPVLCWTTGMDMRVVAASGWAVRRHRVWAELIGRTITQFHEQTNGEIPIPPLEPHRLAFAGKSVSLAISWNDEEWTISLEPLREGRDTVVGVIGLAVLRGLTEDPT